MASKKKKKKGRGKGKKAAKMFGGKEEGRQQRTLDAQMERLKIDEDSQTNADEEALLDEAIKLAVAEKEALKAGTSEREEDQRVKSLITNHSNGCYHGYVEIEDEIKFAETFVAGFGVICADFGDNLILEAVLAAMVEKYPEVCFDPSKLKQVVSLFFFNGTQQVLEGELSKASFFASIACTFEEFAAVYSGEKDKPSKAKTRELCVCNERTLVKYLRKRIPCSCLDEKYEEVKSITKTGSCCNPQCSLPDRYSVERSKLLCCSRCRDTNYCSRECQKADWPKHKSVCDEIANWKTFDN